MNVASLELCKELYELSGWKSDYAFYANGVDKANLLSNATPTYAYDLGYLLRKLDNLDVTLYHYAKNSWHCGIDEDYPSRSAHTPENAVCKLAIVLFMGGILTPTNSKEASTKGGE